MDLIGTNYLLSTLSLMAILFSIYIIISKNPIVSVLFLIGLFFSISLYLITIGLHFLGLTYLIVYVGAVSILFLFILMLINIRISELLTDNRNSIPLAIFTILCFNLSVNDILPYNTSLYNVIDINDIKWLINLPNKFIPIQTSVAMHDVSDSIIVLSLSKNIANVTSKSWDGAIITLTHITSIGNILYTNLFVLFIITSLILLLAMIGAIIITINKPKINNELNLTNSSKSNIFPNLSLK